MNFYQFNDLNDISKLDIAWREGILLGELNDGKFLFALYQLDSFYVEAKFNALCTDFYGIRAFQSTSCHLQKYLDDIDLSFLDKNFSRAK